MLRLLCSITLILMATQGCLSKAVEPYFRQICDSALKCSEDEIGKELCGLQFLPTTEKELDLYCPSINRIMWCAAKSIFIWTPPNNSIDNFITSGFNLMNVICEICKPYSQLHQDYLAGVSCFKKLLFDGFTYDICLEYGRQTVQSLNISMDGTSEENELSTMCMSTFYGLACFVAATRNSCGRVASGMVKEILQKIKLWKFLNCIEASMGALTMKLWYFEFPDKFIANIFVSFF